MKSGGSEAVRLIVGYGNELRGDDGVGPRAAQTTALWNVPGVRAVAVHQLTPELADAMAAADVVLFIDAAESTDALTVGPLEPASQSSGWGHVSDAAALLALTESLHGRRPPALLLAIPVRDFRFGTELSSVGARGLEQALRWISTWLEEALCTRSA